MKKQSIYMLAATMLTLTPVMAAATGVHTVKSGAAEQTRVKGHTQPTIAYANVWADKQGATHVEHCRIQGLDFKSYAPPAAPQWIGVSPDQIDSISYAVLPPGYKGNWHHAPGPQWVVTLSGKWSVETTDGSVLTQGPGDMQFNADAGSHPRGNDKRVGHVSRTVGDKPNVQLIIKLKPGVNPQQNAECAG